ncbi:hypothetical protein C8J57DRAFT_1731846 [Mycena rebaudengoi]|nr:hypothetical protein C8J57DRAFT_1731846 [Mycena rebaudengoi]
MLARRRARVHPAARRRRSFASRPASSMHSFLCNARLRRSRMRRHRRSIVRPPRRHPHLRSPHHNPYTSAAGDDRTRSETALSAAATHWPSTTANADILDTLQRRSSRHLLSASRGAVSWYDCRQCAGRSGQASVSSTLAVFSCFCGPPVSTFGELALERNTNA